MNLVKGIFISVICVLTVLPVKAQIAGMSALSGLDVTLSPRASALGMDYLSVADADLATVLDNPSLITQGVHNHVALSFASLFGTSTFGTLAYGVKTRSVGSFVFGFRFHNYGRFQGYDENDLPTRDFYAEDYLLSAGWAFTIDSNFSLGATLKPVFSQYESYRACAIDLDVAGTFVSDSRRFSATLAARNLGAQIATFDGTVEKLPFELSASLSYKLKNAPFRLFFAANELQRWKLSYDDPLNPTSVTDQFTGETTSQSPPAAFFDNLARHAVVGVELDIKHLFFARMGYSYRQTKETQLSGVFNGSGFSFGFGIRVKGVEFSYARNNYHYSQAPNFFSLSADLSRLF